MCTFTLGVRVASKFVTCSKNLMISQWIMFHVLSSKQILHGPTSRTLSQGLKQNQFGYEITKK